MILEDYKTLIMTLLWKSFQLLRMSTNVSLAKSATMIKMKTMLNVKSVKTKTNVIISKVLVAKSSNLILLRLRKQSWST